MKLFLSLIVLVAGASLVGAQPCVRNADGTMTCPCAPGTVCPDGCVNNGDGTCTCPQSVQLGRTVGYVVPTPPGVQQATYQSSQATYSNAGASCGSSASSGHRRFRLFGRRRRCR